MFQFVVGWTIALGGLFMAGVCALNCLGLARGSLRTGGERIGILGLGMVSAGLAGFMWDMPLTDGPVETWRFYWLAFGSLGLVLMAVSQARSGEAAALWRRARQGARIYTNRSEWRPKHFLILGLVAASAFALSLVPDDRWFSVVALLAFLAVLDTLKLLPIHFGRRPPKPLGSTSP